MIGLSVSTYYADPKVSRAEREEFEADVRDKIEQIRCDMPGAGYRILLPLLKRAGITIGERRLRGILKKFSLQIRPKKRFVKTTDSNHDHEVYPNLIEEMTITAGSGISKSMLTTEDEVINVVFTKHIKPPKKKFATATDPDDL